MSDSRIKEHVRIMIWNVTGSLIRYTMDAKDEKMGGVDPSVYDGIFTTLRNAKETLEVLERLIEEEGQKDE